MDDLLFLAHRIPYPPNKGDKIRSYHLLRFLVERYRIHLGAFVDDPADMRHTKHLASMCASTCLLPLDPRRARIRSLRGLVAGTSLTEPYYRDSRMQRWVDGVVSSAAISRVLVFSSAMAQYARGDNFRGMLRIADYVDVDSDKWRQYGASRRWPISWIYRREGRRLLAFERAAAAEFDHIIFVSHAEAQLFRNLAPEVAERISWVENGVDTDYFSPTREYPDPYGAGEQVLVFTGAMDYWANVDAVRWFAADVLPLVRAEVPACRFYIVGSRPTEAVRRLADLSGVTVTGAVPDVRPYLAHAVGAVAPLRIARGVQNKVLEAMAMNRAVILTPQAMDGLADSVLLQKRLAESPQEMAAHAVRLLQEGDCGDGVVAGSWVREHYDWNRNLSGLSALFERRAHSVAAAVPMAANLAGR